jgi:hypothetical protein
MGVPVLYVVLSVAVVDNTNNGKLGDMVVDVCFLAIQKTIVEQSEKEGKTKYTNHS